MGLRPVPWRILAGGPPIHVAAVPAARSGAWNPEPPSTDFHVGAGLSRILAGGTLEDLAVSKQLLDGSYGGIGGDYSSIRFQTQLGGDEKITRLYWQDPWSHAAISKIAEMCASARLRIYSDRSPDAEPISDDDPLYKFFERPHPTLSYARWMRLCATWEWLFGDLVHALRVGDGDTWIKAPPDLAGLVEAEDRASRIQFWPLKPDLVNLIFHENGTPSHWEFEDRFRGTVKIPLEAVVHIFTPDPYDAHMRRGVGRATAILRTANLDWQAERFTEADMRTGGAPNTVIKTKYKLTDEQRKALGDHYQEKHGKPEFNGKPLVVDKETEVEFPGHSAKDMAWAEVRAWNRDTKIAVLGANKAILGMTNDDTRANAQEGRRNAWQDTILPRLTRFAGELEQELLPKLGPPYDGYGIQFDTSHIEALQADSKEQWDTAKVIFDTFPGQTLATTATLLDIEIPEGVPADEEKPEPEPVLPGVGGPPGAPAAKAIDVMELPAFRATAARVFAEGTLGAEQAIKKRTASVFKGYVKKAARMAHELAKEAGAPVLERDFSPDQIEALLPDIIAWQKLLADQVTPVERRLYLLQARMMADALGAERISTLADPYAAMFLADKEIVLKETLVTLREAVKEAIQRSLLEEGGVGTLADQIRNALERYESELEIMQGSLGARAERIARTESTSIANGARFNEAKEQGVAEMRWITARDSNVREEHEEIDGEVRAVGAEFAPGLKFPGDPDAEPGLVINCRCSITPTARGVGKRAANLNEWHRAMYLR